MDRKVVTFLTSEHNLDLIPTGKTNYRNKEPITKPKVMLMYNKFMGGVDRNDQLAKYSAFNHRSLKWWKKVFFRILNLCMVNAFILYNEWCAIQGKPKLKQLKFCRNVMSSWQLPIHAYLNGIFLLIFHRKILRGELHWLVLFVDQL